MKKLIFIILLLFSFDLYALKGVLITEPEQLNTIPESSTTFGFMPNSLDEIKDVLEINKGKYTPIINISRYFWNDSKGIFEYYNVEQLKNAFGDNKVILMLDEPFWWIKSACNEGKWLACNEVKNNYKNTRELFKRVKFELNYQLLHIESYLILIEQKQLGAVKLIESADHVGFDCYSEDFNNCGGYSQLEYASWLYDSILDHQKIFLIAGSFLSDGFFRMQDIDKINLQLEQTFYLYNNYKNIVSGIGIFSWGSIDNSIIGAYNIPTLKNKIEELLK